MKNLPGNLGMRLRRCKMEILSNFIAVIFVATLGALATGAFFAAVYLVFSYFTGVRF